MNIEALYKEYKPLLFSISYGMLGTVTEAEDVVQEIFLTLQQEKLDHVQNIKAYLSKMATNKCIDVLRSAQKKRIVYVGEWLPEPIGAARFNEVEEKIENRDLLSLVYLKLMEVLTPNERAVFLLKEGFSLSHAEISHMLETNEVNCRKLYSRAKKKMGISTNGRFTVKENREVIESFIQAFQMGEMERILGLLSPDVILYSDGGGVAKAAIRPIETVQRVLPFLQGVYSKRPENMIFVIESVNGQPGLVGKVDNETHNVISFYIADNRIQAIYLVVNPEKLKNV
ncbi:MAG TPA: RNA polymerase sigma-70 factor [Bacillus sp. (in: firmicutes)]|nr:RNA polymerase sigma-70 factor [Bacillus sp. (in: firmicutes)]